MVFVSFFFLRVIPHPGVYEALPGSELRRPKSAEQRRSLEREPVNEASGAPFPDTEETASLISSSSSNAGDEICDEGAAKANGDHSHHLDIRGLGLLLRLEFWNLFALLALLAGVGLMSINNIGNDAQALWSHYDDSADPKFIQKWQAMHVSILSVMSFTGRLLSGKDHMANDYAYSSLSNHEISGVGSDLIVKKLGMSRFWCLVASSSIFSIGQLCAIKIENPHHLWAVSGLTGRMCTIPSVVSLSEAN
ncbi:hypothetical protein FGG08_005330 [Glutinoglossum americanum]|uniref:Uncharacterized protein n=1 Tax=Glutinoglossum americanum TaxID=1670608 RepID=A0A9P8HUR3_9PEZI|nr:hypothetical protein FGG08_005330 [Glutinoglossum americanum]